MTTDFAQRLGGKSGIVQLMDDLGEALARGGPDVKMLGGGQPAHIPEMDAVWQRRMEELTAEPRRLDAVLGNYDPPRGNPDFLEIFASVLRAEFGWDVGVENLAVTSGGQTAFFFLFNALAGEGKKILLPLVPEYIGYASQGVDGDLFSAVRPQIELLGENEFKYRVDFDALEIGPEVAAVCASRPTNPTGNVLTDSEVESLRSLAKRAGVPLILDNAYGVPFPGIIYTEATPVWDEDIILTLSLSKLGLPGTRTGIVVARPEIARMISAMSANVGLANGNLGQAIVSPLLKSGELLDLCETTVQPFYLRKSKEAQALIRDVFRKRFPWRHHVSEGALFLWLWFPDLPISSRELYDRLKARKVLVIPGEDFFYGLGADDADWRHRKECIRVTFTMSQETVKVGLEIIAEEVERAVDGRSR